MTYDICNTMNELLTIRTIYIIKYSYKKIFY